MIEEQNHIHHAATALGDTISIGPLDDPSSDLEIFAREVLSSLINHNLPPTPNNFALYFDRILDEKNEGLRRQIGSILELEENNEDEQGIQLEKTLKQGFSSIKSILQLSATLYKNITLMEKILDKRKAEIKATPSLAGTNDLLNSLGDDIGKLGGILNSQLTHMKDLYGKTASIIKQVDNETIFDAQLGIYNKRYLLSKLTQELHLITEFHHKSSLILVRLSDKTSSKITSEKIRDLMARTVARLLLKTSRRSDTVAHYGNGIFGILLKHTDIENSKRAADRLYDLVLSSNFFIGEQEITLHTAIGVAQINEENSVEHLLVSTLEALELSNKEHTKYVVTSNA